MSDISSIFVEIKRMVQSHEDLSLTRVSHTFELVHGALRNSENLLSRYLEKHPKRPSDTCDANEVVLMCCDSEEKKPSICTTIRIDNADQMGQTFQDIDEALSKLSDLCPGFFSKIFDSYSASMPFGGGEQTWTFVLQAASGVRALFLCIKELISHCSLASKLPMPKAVMRFEEVIVSFITDYEIGCLSSWTHWQEQAFSLGTHRQDWQSYSPYMRNKRISPTIALVVSSTRQAIITMQRQTLSLPFLLSISQRKQVEETTWGFAHKLLQASLMSIISTFVRLPVSRTRLWQWQVDFIYLIHATLDTLQSFFPVGIEEHRNHQHTISPILAQLLYIDFLLCITTTTDLDLVDRHIHQDVTPTAKNPAPLTIGAASITSNTRFWLERLRQRWYAPSMASEQTTSHCILMKSATSARPSLAAFNLSFDLLALVGRVEDDGGHRFVLSATELDLFQRELANAQMESGHITSNVAMTSATSASVASAVAAASAKNLASMAASSAKVDPNASNGITSDDKYTDRTANTVGPGTPDTLQPLLRRQVDSYQDVAALACREVLFSRFVTNLQDLTAALAPTAASTVPTATSWTPLLLESDATTTQVVALLLDCQYRVLLHSGFFSAEESQLADPKCCQKVLESWIQSIRLHRPEVIEPADGQQLFPPLNEAEKDRIPMLMSTFSNYFYI